MSQDALVHGTPGPNLRPVVATLFGIPVAVIVLAALDGRQAPIVGDGTAAVVALLVLGSAMCALGMESMSSRFGRLPSTLVGAPFGVVILLFLLSGLFGWSLLLDPVVDALGGPESVSLARAAIVGAGALMAVKWAIGWLSYVPRRRSMAS